MSDDAAARAAKEFCDRYELSPNKERALAAIIRRETAADVRELVSTFRDVLQDCADRMSALVDADPAKRTILLLGMNKSLMRAAALLARYGDEAAG